MRAHAGGGGRSEGDRHGMDHTITGEIDVELSRLDDAGAVVAAWFDDGLTALAADARHAIETGPRLPAAALRRAMPCGPAGAVWGFVSVGEYPRMKTRIYTAANMRWMLDELKRDPRDARLKLCRLDSAGYPGERIAEIRFPVPGEGLDWGRFCIDVPASRLADPVVRTAFLEAMRGLAEVAEPFYGQVGEDDALGRTQLEMALGVTVLPRECYEARHGYLRGYEWLTVVPPGLAERLGGASALRGTGAFADVVELPGGAVWLQATPAFEDYDPAAAEAVWRAVAPVLRPGIPRPPENDRPLVKVVVDDAAEARADPERRTPDPLEPLLDHGPVCYRDRDGAEIETRDDRWILHGLRDRRIRAVSWAADRAELAVAFFDGATLTARGAAMLTRGGIVSVHQRGLPDTEYARLNGRSAGHVVVFTSGALRMVFSTGHHVNVTPEPGGAATL